MATEYNRQYIGARYVPKFFNNPDGSWDWAQGFQYEPLTMVKYGENTYTSKMLVPATVGSPNLNPEYWANTGNYNGFINSLEAKVQNNTNDISELKEKISKIKRRYILIGDSFAMGVHSESSSGTGWIQSFHNIKPEDTFYLQESLPGVYGFTSSRTFLSVLQAIIPSIDDINTITDILITGGTNELGASGNINNLPLAIDEFMNYVYQNIPNAKVTLACVGTSIIHSNPLLYKYYKGIEGYGGTFVDELFNIMYDPNFLSDGTHLTQNGYNITTPYILNGLINGSVKFSFIKQYNVSLFETNVIMNFIITDSGYSINFSLNNNPAPNFTTSKFTTQYVDVEIGQLPIINYNYEPFGTFAIKSEAGIVAQSGLVYFYLDKLRFYITYSSTADGTLLELGSFSYASIYPLL